MKLPNLIIFGAIKSGTGALHQYLNHHPDIFMSPEKEPRYFLHEDDASDKPSEPNAAWPRTLEAYSRVFDKAAKQQIIGESSSNYIISSFAADKIRKVIPNVKLVASLRNPVDRALAHYNMDRRIEKFDESMLSQRTEPWATTSLYFDQLSKYYQIFPPENIKIMIMEEWSADVEFSLEDLYAFLGVDLSFKLNSSIRYRPAVIAWPEISSGSWMRKMKPLVPRHLLALVSQYRTRNWQDPIDQISADMRSEMMEWYSEDIAKLENLLGRNLSIWR